MPSFSFSLLAVCFFYVSTFPCLAIPPERAKKPLIQMAITVDDIPLIYKGVASGEPDLNMINKIIAALKKHHLKGVYGFVNGGRVKENPAFLSVIEQWTKSGNLIANHTFSHMNLANTSAEDFMKDIALNDKLLSSWSTNKKYKVFRYPFLQEGETIEKRDMIRKFLFENGYSIAQVTVDGSDWLWNKSWSKCIDRGNQIGQKFLRDNYFLFAKSSLADAIRDANTLYQRQIAHILLLHVTSITADLLDELLTEYERQGVTFISLKNAMKDQIYHEDLHFGSQGKDMDYLSQLFLSKKIDRPAATERLPSREDVLKICE